VRGSAVIRARAASEGLSSRCPSGHHDRWTSVPVRTCVQIEPFRCPSGHHRIRRCPDTRRAVAARLGRGIVRVGWLSETGEVPGKPEAESLRCPAGHRIGTEMRGPHVRDREFRADVPTGIAPESRRPRPSVDRGMSRGNGR